MSRQKDTEVILKAAEKWKQQCLLDSGSIFSEESLWTRENFDQLRIHFVDNLDYGSGDFYQKLERQLAPSPTEAKHLWAEMTWVYYLIVSSKSLKSETKLKYINRVWEWSGSVLPNDHWALGEVLAHGIVNAGQAYYQYRWREFQFFITTMLSWFSRSSEDRVSLMTNPWDFAEWLDAQEYCQGRQFRHAFLFLLFPDEFEPIISQKHKEEIVKAFYKKWNEDLLINDGDNVIFKVFSNKRNEDVLINDGDNVALDQALLKIRERLEVEDISNFLLFDEDVNFYNSPFRDVWQPSQPSPQLPPPEVKETASSYSIDNILADGCFLEREKLETILQRIRDKKNLILQGPPGTGKTWLAKKLAFALIGEREEDKIRPVQFHPNLSYEDFVRGWRPSGDGKLDLVDGPFPSDDKHSRKRSRVEICDHH